MSDSRSRVRSAQAAPINLRGLRPAPWLLAILVGSHALVAGAQSAPVGQFRLDVAAIDATITRAMSEQNIPGVALGIVYQGELVHARGFGKANLEQDVPVTPDTVFAIASVSKPIIALTMAALVEQGKLKWEDPVSRHLPGTPPAWSAIRLSHLASHTSGVLRESPAFDGEKIKSDFEVVSAAYRMPLEFETGTRMQYCNVCYFALAEVITRTAGEPWPKVVERTVFAPAGMTRTRTTSTRDLVPGRAASYEFRDGRYFNVREYVALRPSGAFLSTVNDLARLEKALHERRLLKPASLRAIEQPALLNDGKPGSFGNSKAHYGLGWELNTVRGERQVSHGGSLAGFRTLYARYPDSGWALILLTNSAGAKVAQLGNQVAEILLKTPHPRLPDDASK